MISRLVVNHRDLRLVVGMTVELFCTLCSGSRASCVACVLNGLLAVVLLSCSTANATSPIEVNPIDPAGWVKEQDFAEGVHAELLAHIEGAKNISIPKAPRAFAWKIDWKAQQAYCLDIADALFKNKRRLSFPAPTFSATRDSTSKLVEVLHNLIPPVGQKWRLPSDSPEGVAADVEAAIAVASTKLGRPTRMR